MRKEKLEISIVVTESDIKKLGIAQERKKKKYTLYWRAYMIAAVPTGAFLLLSLAGYLVFGSTPTDAGWDLYELLTLVIALPPVGIAAMPYIQVEMEKARNPASVPPKKRSVQYRMDESGILVKTEGTEKKVTWSEVVKVEVLKAFYCIHLSAEDRLVFPKKKFPGPEDLEAFRWWFRTRIPPSRIV
ncbi:YcxB family protein [Balneolaceae bacterium ANBcel3]|nr:YcxB family protein [Balneolaceae bacterium ANBcel3]